MQGYLSLAGDVPKGQLSQQDEWEVCVGDLLLALHRGVCVCGCVCVCDCVAVTV